MLKVIEAPGDIADLASAIKSAWHQNNVIHVKNVDPGDLELRDFYQSVLSRIGELAPLAEDARIADRQMQRNGEVWFEVANDSNFPNAYRHSTTGQPLHTDGSYIPNFPNAGLLACVSNCEEGGETIFLDGPKLVEILNAKKPLLLARLQEVVVPHKRSGDYRAAPILQIDPNDGSVILNWNYYCVDHAASPEVLALKEEFFQFLKDEPEIAQHLVPIKLMPNDAVIWKDDRLLHGRNSFKANKDKERFIWKAAVNIGLNEL